MNDFNKLGLWKKAQKAATFKLNKQKLKTGVAILGTPSAALKNDKKFQGSFLTDSIKVGENLAMQALSSEMLILITLDTPRQEWHRYIGRSQYPRFKTKSVAASNNKPLYCDEDLLYWGSVKTLAAATLQIGISAGYLPAYFFKGTGVAILIVRISRALGSTSTRLFCISCYMYGYNQDRLFKYCFR